MHANTGYRLCRLFAKTAIENISRLSTRMNFSLVYEIVIELYSQKSYNEKVVFRWTSPFRNILFSTFTENLIA